MGAGSIRRRNIIMATIGTFKKSGTGYTGAITTLSYAGIWVTTRV